MIKVKTVFIFTLVFFVHQLFATSVTVRILTTKVIRSFIFSPLRGEYTLYGDGQLLSDCDASGIYEMSIDGDSNNREVCII